MYPYSYTISLGLRHPTQSLKQEFDKLSNISALVPGYLQDINEQRKSVKNQPLPGNYSESACGFSLEGYKDIWINSHERSMSDSLREIFSILAPHKPLFVELYTRGARAHLMIGLAVEKMSGENFDEDIFKELHEYHLGIELHLYP